MKQRKHLAVVCPVPQLLSVKQVAFYLGASRAFVRGERLAGRLRAIRLGRNIVRYRQSDIDDYLNAHQVEVKAA